MFELLRAQGWVEETHTHSVSRLSLSDDIVFDKTFSNYQHVYVQTELVESDARVKTTDRINAI